jgi:hypothetical protein
MALENARYTAIHDKTGSDKDKLKDEFDAGHAQRLAGRPDKEPLISSIMYQLGLMQEELDYLRGIISSNKDKTGITTAQANAITANTAKAGMVLGTTNKTALAGDTTTISTDQAKAITANSKLGQRLQASTQASLTKSTAIEFGEFTTTVSGKTTTYSIPITVTETTIGGKGNTTITKTGSITLT